MIRSEEVFYIGKVSKFRGIQGEVEILFTDDAFDRGDAEYLVLEMEGILVPFFWEEYRFKNDKTAIFQFEDIHDETAARRIVGASVYYPKAALPEDGEEGAELRSWQALTGFARNSCIDKGFALYHADGTPIGTVQAVDDATANILLIIDRADGTQTYLPFHEDFLVEARLKERALFLNVPPGLLEIND